MASDNGWTVEVYQGPPRKPTKRRSSGGAWLGALAKLLSFCLRGRGTGRWHKARRR